MKQYGNGAFEALVEIFKGDKKFVTALLTFLWLSGYKVVPLAPEDK